MSAPYTITLSSRARRELHKLDGKTATRIGAAIDDLTLTPRPAGIKAMVGRHGYYRLRVGDYRVIYTVRDAELLILVVEIGRRRDIYEH